MIHYTYEYNVVSTFVVNWDW